MKKLILLLSYCLYSQPSHASTLPDFHLALGKNNPLFEQKYKQSMQSEQAKKIIDFLATLYEKNITALLNPDEKPRIPKIIHQIWLGSPVPERFKAFQEEWIAMHHDWEYRLWTEKEIGTLDLENKRAYEKAINYGERSDIARYEILYRFGGVYVDMDFECLYPLNILHHSFDFYTGIEPLAKASFLSLVIINNGLIGSVPSHPILRSCIDAIKQNANEKDIVIKTGPMMFTKAFLTCANTDNTRDIAMPPTFFYPITNDISDPEQLKKYIMPETFAIHHWAGSWILKEEAFVPGIKIRSKLVGNTITFSIVDEREINT